jgi:hypothetical protein
MPTERVVATSIFGCTDGFLESKPTCGFKYSSKNEKIVDSQGFCCSCGIGDIFGIDTN